MIEICMWCYLVKITRLTCMSCFSFHLFVLLLTNYCCLLSVLVLINSFIRCFEKDVFRACALVYVFYCMMQEVS